MTELAAYEINDTISSENLIDVDVVIYKYNNYLFYSKKLAEEFLKAENENVNKLETIKSTITITKYLLYYLYRYSTYFNLIFSGYIDTNKPPVLKNTNYDILTYLIFSDHCKIICRYNVKRIIYLKYIKQLKSGKKISLPKFVKITDIPVEFDDYFEQWYHPNLFNYPYSSELYIVFNRLSKYFRIWKNDINLSCDISSLLKSKIPFEEYLNDILEETNYNLTSYIDELVSNHIDKFHLWKDYVDKLHAICSEPKLVLEYDLEDLKDINNVDIYIRSSKILTILNNKVILNRFKQVPILEKLLYQSLFINDNPININIAEIFNDEKSLYYLSLVISDVIKYDETFLSKVIKMLISNPKLAEKVSKIINLDKSLTS